MDYRRAVCMVMLDMSAAFVTLDHDLIIEQLGTTQRVTFYQYHQSKLFSLKPWLIILAKIHPFFNNP